MSLHAGTPLAASLPAALYSRYFQGSIVTLSTPHGSVRLSQNHPVLSHAGWVPARSLRPGAFVVTVELEEAAPSAGDLFAAHATTSPTVTLTASRREFWGDGQDGPVQTLGAWSQPLCGEEGQSPALDSRPVLERLTTASEFGASTWAQACATVPGLGRYWPQGEPSLRAAGVGAATAHRLGEAMAALPEPPTDRAALAWELCGLVGTLRLSPVTAVDETIGGIPVVDVVSAAGCCVAWGIVVG